MKPEDNNKQEDLNNEQLDNVAGGAVRPAEKNPDPSY